MKKILFILILVINLNAKESALEAFQHKDYKKAYSLYKKMALDGNATAMSALSYLYFNGLGTNQDKINGLKYLKQSADLNNSNALLDLGIMYLIGKDTHKDVKKAFEYLTKSSQLKNSEAQFNLALMYYNGDGVDANVSKSAELLESAANSGNKKAIKNVGRIYMQLLKFENAKKWLEINAKNGDKEAQSLLKEIEKAK